MVQNSKFTIQLLEKIGAPLAAAIESVPLSGEDQDLQSAKIMAQMLGQAVQVSISLNASFNIVEEEAQADSTRLALASLAAPLLADFYKQNEHVPEDPDIKRLIKSLESVVAFADNFSAAEEGKSRLTTLDHDAPLFDKTQSALVVMQAMGPVMSAIAEFSFGQSEVKLMQDIAGKLEKTAADIAKSANLNDKLSELMVLKALAALYAECHRSETQKLANAAPDSEAARAELSLGPVWEAFGVRTAMIEAVLGLENNSGVTTASAVAPAPVAAVPTSEPVATAVPVGGPMGFFKKPDVAVAPAEPIVAETPEPVSTPETPAVATAEEAMAPSEAPPSSPMGFFKPGVKKADDAAS
jgi:hypothetical protein